MATPSSDIDGVVEECAGCDRRTLHAVAVEIHAEGPDSANAAYSREPYRVSECTVCGATSELRMNDA